MNTSVDSAGSNHSATHGHASAVGEAHAACGYVQVGMSVLKSVTMCTEEASARELYNYGHLLHETLDVEGDCL